jgi:hypothetical protein
VFPLDRSAARDAPAGIPMKTADGVLVWAPSLPAETINEIIIARASARNPQETMEGLKNAGQFVTLP